MKSGNVSGGQRRAKAPSCRAARRSARLQAGILGGLLLASVGCVTASPRGIPTRSYVKSLRCLRLVRDLSRETTRAFVEGRKGRGWDSTFWQRQIAQTKCPVSHLPLSFEGTPDGTSFVLYCKGEHHLSAGFAPDHPRFTQDRGLEIRPGVGPQLPIGFPLDLPFRGIGWADAGQDESIEVQLDLVDGAAAIPQLEKTLGQPVYHSGNPTWIRDEIAGADQFCLVVDCTRGTAVVRYTPSHLAPDPEPVPSGGR